jgi:diacylglycerol kinase (ATP)
VSVTGKQVQDVDTQEAALANRGAGVRGDGGTPIARGAPSLIQSFNYAFEGVIWVLKRERNMRLHVAAAVIVMVLAVVLDASKLELIALLLAIALVLIAEMFNTAIEAATDIATSSFHPLAKIAKDVSAGAVLIASANAVAVGAIVFTGHAGGPTDRALRNLHHAPALPTAIGLLVVLLLVIAVKAATGSGTPLRGGLPSGHAALAFAGWTAITFVTEGFSHRVLVSALAFALAFLVAHTRVESGIHTGLEVALGALLGSGVTLLLFQAL